MDNPIVKDWELPPASQKMDSLNILKVLQFASEMQISDFTQSLKDTRIIAFAYKFNIFNQFLSKLKLHFLYSKYTNTRERAFPRKFRLFLLAMESKSFI